MIATLMDGTKSDDTHKGVGELYDTYSSADAIKFKLKSGEKQEGDVLFIENFVT